MYTVTQRCARKVNLLVTLVLPYPPTMYTVTQRCTSKATYTIHSFSRHGGLEYQELVAPQFKGVIQVEVVLYENFSGNKALCDMDDLSILLCEVDIVPV